MSFTGDLEHLPLVDIIQLLHSTRKTGTLCLRGPKGESQLVFSDGYFVSANHVNNSVRVGQLLLAMNAITQEELDKALQEQKQAGPGRKPLIATLIEQGTIKKEDAYKGLEELIEMTIVEVLTWKSGTFSLDISSCEMSDEYRYFPEILEEEILLNAQSILMDALRIYDERMRDGTLSEIFFSSTETSEEEIENTAGSQAITADLLGLDNLDQMKKTIPSVFTGLKDYDPYQENRRVINEELGDLPKQESDRLCEILTNYSRDSSFDINSARDGGPALAIILFSRDNFIAHAMKSVCKHERMYILVTDEEENLDLIIEQSLSREHSPVLVIDSSKTPSTETEGRTNSEIVKTRLERFPHISIIQTIYPPDHEHSQQLFKSGVRAVLPRPCKKTHKETFVDDTTTFLATFQSYLRSMVSPNHNQLIARFKTTLTELDSMSQPPEIAGLLLNFVSTLFERSITFVVGRMELIAERGIGIKADKSAGPTPPMMFKIPLDQTSVFQEVTNTGNLYYGNPSDTIIDSHLFENIRPSHSKKILLLPIKSFGRVIAIIYADFGDKNEETFSIDLLEILARHASLVLDYAFYRKRFEKPVSTKE